MRLLPAGLAGLALVFSVAGAAVVSGVAAVPGTTERLSVSSTSVEANGMSFDPFVTAGGRFVSFTSAATNLVAGDTNGAFDVFVRDRDTGATERVSVDSGGVQANGDSGGGPLSTDGRFVAFVSDATNLVPNDTNGCSPGSCGDIFVRDRSEAVTERVSVDSAGLQANSWSGSPSISGDGRFVAFLSGASNLVADDTNTCRSWTVPGTCPDVFVHDRVTGTTERVSVDSAGHQANGSSYAPALSADGRFVAFSSDASNLVADDTNGVTDVFVRDRVSGMTERVSLGPGGAQGDSASGDPSISADGSRVAFPSSASNLVAGDTNNALDVFIRDRAGGITQRASLNDDGQQANSDSAGSQLTADGRFVVFMSSASNLVPDDTNGRIDVFVRDLKDDTTERVSVDSLGNQGNADSCCWVGASGEGHVVAFMSNASNLAVGDTNNTSDIFARNRCFDGTCEEPPAVTPTPAPATSTPTASPSLTPTATASPTITPVPQCREDVDGNGTVNGRDVSAVARALWSRPGQTRWNAAADVNQDGRVDLVDLLIVVRSLHSRPCNT